MPDLRSTWFGPSCRNRFCRVWAWTGYRISECKQGAALANLINISCRLWTIVIPAYLMVLVLLTYFSYAALMAFNTPAIDSLKLITGKYKVPISVDVR